jgi:hypothetical protein
MPIASQRQFIAGEVAPRFHRRSDLQFYSGALKECKNFYPVVSGALVRRPAVHYFTTPKTPSLAVRYYDFVFNNEQAFLLEFGNNYIRFHSQAGTILSGGNPYEVTTTYTTAQVSQLRFAQINDVVYIVHPAHPPRRLTRLANDNWTLALVGLIDGPYDPINTTSTTMTISGTSPNFTITASSATFNASRDVGRLFRFQTASNSLWTWGTITAVASATVATFAVAPNQTTPSGASILWRFGAFYANNYPANVVFHNNRLVYARTNSHPSTGWLSMFNNLEQFSPSSTITNADNIGTTNSISFTLASQQSSSILWLVSDTSLLVGTESGIFASNTDVITPANFSMSFTLGLPMASISPVKVEGHIIVVSRLRNKVFGISFSNEARGYVSQDLSIYWEHLLDRRIANMVYVSYPTPIVWMTMDDGSLVAMTYMKEQNIVAMTQHRIEQCTVNRVLALPNFATGSDVLWLDLTRNNQRLIGYMAREYSSSYFDDASYQSSRYLDLYLVASSITPTTTFSGAEIHANSTVSCIADGILKRVTVQANGTFTLDAPASDVVIGLPYMSTMTTLDIPMSDTAMMVYRKKCTAVKLSLMDALYANVSLLRSASPSQQPVDVFEAVRLPVNNPVYTASGQGFTQVQSAINYREVTTGETIAKSVQSGVQESVEVTVWIDEPLPLTILGIHCDLFLEKF